MRFLALIVSVLLTTSVGADDDCTFDPVHQRKVLTAIAKQFPGGSLNLEARSIAWTTSSEGITIFSYGGCEDLGSVITRATAMSTPRTKGEIFALAKTLALKFWQNKAERVEPRAAETLIMALKNSAYDVNSESGSTVYSVRHSSYVELYVEHRYENGIDTVSLGWQGNY